MPLRAIDETNELFDIEFQYLLAASLNRPLPPASMIRDWDKLCDLARRHRVDGLIAAAVAADGTKAIPDNVRDHFDRRRRQLSFSYLNLLHETLQATKLLSEHGIQSIVLKGCTTAEVLYTPLPELRHAVDIDLLVAPHDLSKADELFRHEGYLRTSPNFVPSRTGESMVRYLLSDYVFVHPKTQITIELHHRLLHNPHVLPMKFDHLFATSREIAIGGGSINGLAGSLNLAYLCAHAAGHAFFRLKWFADIDRAFSKATHAEKAALLSRARTLGYERPMLLTFALAERFDVFRSWSLQYPGSHIPSALVEHCLTALQAPEKNHTHNISDLPSDVRDLMFRTRLAETWRARRYGIVRSLAHDEDVRVLKLGVKWSWLYALLGRPLAALRLMRRTHSMRSLFARQGSDASQP